MIKVIMRRVIGAVVVGVVGLVAGPLAGTQTVAGAAPAATAATNCAVTWGSLAKSDRTFQIRLISDVRTGRHAR